MRLPLRILKYFPMMYFDKTFELLALCLFQNGSEYALYHFNALENLFFVSFLISSRLMT